MEKFYRDWKGDIIRLIIEFVDAIELDLNAETIVGPWKIVPLTTCRVYYLLELC